MGSFFSDEPAPAVQTPAPTATPYKPLFLQQPATAATAATAQTPAAKPPRAAKDIVLPMIRDWETFQPKVYDDGYGNPTIGYGMTTLPNGQKVTWKTPSITKEEGEKMLLQKVDSFSKILEKFPTFKTLKPNQQAAVLDLAFNIGPNFDAKGKDGKPKFPTLLAVMSDPKRADELKTLIPQFRKANGSVSKGLESRRKDTLAMFADENFEYKPRSERK